MLKPFHELIKLDVRPYCDVRDAKDESGKVIKVPYLSWAKCIKLLHEQARRAYGTPPWSARRPTPICGRRRR